VYHVATDQLTVFQGVSEAPISEQYSGFALISAMGSDPEGEAVREAPAQVGRSSA
jgi:hypothetical protein